ncbi:MAG TPA: 23S rRNA (adenine(2503)-C(2))-methyltransferase RlmN [Planctomycetota bacterium]|nr:23S rRNA (adenine(2503)-C(2))-methyltransferase RlmN [Planctomycetota bacterium]
MTAPQTHRPQGLFELDPQALEAKVVELGGRPFHARILRKEVLSKGILDAQELTSLPAALRAALPEALPLLVGHALDRRESRDGAIKLLTGFDQAGLRQSAIETVYMPSRKKNSTKGATVCVSTQAGCPVGCPFCASGIGGLIRNLKAHEIVEQFVRARALGPISRCVVMGIGEPLLNLEALQRALAIVREGLELGARKVTVSSVGFPERIRRAAASDPRFDLAISLHTPFQEQRDELVPAMAGVPIDEILSAGDDWFAATGREVTYEYVLLGGTNDSEDHARNLVDRLVGRRATVNLIPYNPSPELPFRRPNPTRVENFRALLEEDGLVATVRWSRGLEESAACGQLRAQGVAGETDPDLDSVSAT